MAKRVTGARVPPAGRRKIWSLRSEGHTFVAISRLTGFDRRQVAAICAELVVEPRIWVLVPRDAESLRSLATVWSALLGQSVDEQQVDLCLSTLLGSGRETA